MPAFEIGDRVIHADYGSGTVEHVGENYLTVDFDERYKGLIKKSDPELRLAGDERAAPGAIADARQEQDLPWPESTFVFEKPDTPHYMGSHWDPFTDDAAAVMKQLPRIAKEWLIQTGFGDSRRKPPRQIPENWPRGWHFA